ncbi:MAG: hypothetical protein ABI947_08430 [Chloroflexota bacterium]
MLEQRERSNLQTIRSLLPVVFAGLMLVIVALVIMLWPTGAYGDQGVQTVPHVLRVLRPLPSETGLNIPRRILDVGIYVVVLVGIGALLIAWRRGSRNALVSLIVVGVLGLSYVSGMALYTGPMVSTCGFLLIFFGGLVAWVTSHNEPATSALPDDGDPADRADQIDRAESGTDKYASHTIT